MQFTDSVVRLFGIKIALTDGCKHISETEVVHSIKGQEVVKKLLLPIITAEEGVALVQFSERKNKKSVRSNINIKSNINTSTHKIK